ncbi:MAG TPA: PAS domain S-box protein [Candidatus Angelobacter sp.]|nr:PAS domain S-box protein [Candidatus Angelobacter sp.]
MAPKGPHGRSSRKGETGLPNVLPLLKTQFAVSKLLASTDDLSASLPTILASICINLGWELGAFWQYATSRPVLVCTNISAVDETLGTFIAQARKNELLPGEGLPGRVFATSEPAWVQDLTQEEEFAGSTAITKAELQSAFAFPVLVGNDAIAVLEFFSTKFREPDGELLETMVAIGRQMGQFMKRREAEESLSQSLELYRSLTDSASDAIITMDEESNILLVNRATEEIFGYTASELRGQSIVLLMPSHLRIRYEQALEKYLESDKEHASWHGVEVAGLHKLGHEVLLEVSFGEFRLKDKIFFTGFIRDITQRKQVEAVLKATERLAVLGRLAAGAVHEIKNPLDSIASRLRILEESASPEQAQHLKCSEQELKRIAEIVDHARGFVQDTSTATEVKIQAVLEESLALFSRKIREKHVLIDKRYRCRKNVSADGGELRQVFVNLISNALDSLGKHGQLWLRTYSSPASDGPGAVVVMVADNGKGIRAEHLPKLFQPFFTTKKEEGTGLGLWIAREILHKYGASIKVRNRTGGRPGACFRIVIPLKSNDAIAGNSLVG